MCGIIGAAAREPIASRDWLLRGRDELLHRGPDDSGIVWLEDGRVALAHRRLAIVDLSPAGHQPMQSPDGSVWLIFNGEIYNFRELKDLLEGRGHSFRSSSDTEVVIAAYREWGRSFLDHLDGMFALALFDRADRTVLLARDRAGEKPLFYQIASGGIRFASELKGLMADPDMPRLIDPEALDCYLAFGYIPGDRCMVAGVAKLPAAHALLFHLDTGRHKSWRYWDLPPPCSPYAASDENALVEEFEALLERAVSRQMVADVPVGLLLSGGVDSSIVTALAARSAPSLNTYTVGFEQHAAFDETSHAAQIASFFGTQHTVLQAGGVGPEIMASLARQYDEPLIDSSMIPTYLVTQQIRQHCTVALGGDGGDELFGGYYSASRVAQLQQRLSKIPLWPRRLGAGLATALMPAGMKGRNALRMLATDMSRDLPPIAVHFEPRERQRLLGPRRWELKAEGIRAGRIPDVEDAVERMTRFDFQNYMAEDILVKVDRASMLNSLEVRSPFLDRSVIEFAFGRTPSRLKATPGARKILLRKLADRLLPPSFDNRRKQGFAIPLDHWLKGGPWRDHFEEILLDPGALFSREEVVRLFRNLDSGRRVKEQLFGLALFEHWRRTYSAELAQS
jgi:asparagine synthase (glutamine-hydrolysing)